MLIKKFVAYPARFCFAMSKKQETAPKKLLGRPGNHLKMGIVGLPNVGKSSLFNVLTNMSIPAENFPFCTIDPNESRCAVPDPRFDALCKAFNPASEVPAYLKVSRTHCVKPIDNECLLIIFFYSPFPDH
jgi:hypothetical protein